MKKTTIPAASGQRAARLLLALVLTCALCAPTAALADMGAGKQVVGSDVLTLDGNGQEDVTQAPAVLSTGATVVKSGKWGTCPWTLDSNGTLTVRPGEGDGSIAEILSGSEKRAVKSVVFKSEGGKKASGSFSTSSMFQGLSNLVSIDFSGFDSSQMSNMDWMFDGCSSLKKLDLSSLDTSEVWFMSAVFRGCASLESINLSSFDTSKVTGMNWMFEGCSSLKSLNLSSFDTRKVGNMSSMFKGCSSLSSLDISSFDTSNVKYFDSMFEGCSSLKAIDTKVLDTWSATSVDAMFKDCSSLAALDISSFDMSKITSEYSTWNMFANCTSLSSLTLGKLVKIAGAALPDPPSNYTYTGKWRGPSGSKTSDELCDGYNPSTMAGTWTWEKRASIASATVSGVSDKTYTGSVITQSPTVKLGNVTLKKDTDYALSYRNNVKVGTGTLTIISKGNYAGTKTATFKIVAANVSKSTVSGLSNQTYTGKAITPKPTVKLAGKTLKEGTDYTVSYKNNTKVGTATVTITGKGNYAGTASRTFKIVKAAAKWTRLWGSTQFDTMAKVVQAGWKKNAGGTVVLATAVNFPDALSASGVAGLYGAPVLLTNKASLPAQTRSELARIKPSRVIIAGGPGAIKTSVDAQVKSACGVRPTRCYGSTASDTAAKLATTYVKRGSDTAILATSKFFYDSLSAAPVAYAKHYPILLADSKDAVSKNTLSAMKTCGIRKVIVVGGTSVIGPKIVSQLKANGISVAERLGGQTYYDTSRLIAQWALANGMSANRMGVATSYKFYDALTGASLCGRNNAVLVLADDKGRANASVAKSNRNAILQGYVFGGVNAVGKTTYDSLVSATK